MLTKYFITLVSLLLPIIGYVYPPSAYAQTTGGTTSASSYYVYGTVFQKSDNSPLPFASVQFRGDASFSQKANSGGEFAFIVKPGRYSVWASATGYQSNVCFFDVLKDPVQVTFKLGKLGVDVSSCEITKTSSSEIPIESRTSAQDTVGDGTGGTDPDGTGETSSTTGSTSTSSNSSGATMTTGGQIVTRSNCVVTDIGNPNASPVLPPDCKIGNVGGSGSSIDGGGTFDGKFHYYCQGDPKWSTACGAGGWDTMAACSTRGEAGYCGMGQSGCGPTSLAMIMKSFGVNVNPLDVDGVFQQNRWRNGCEMGSDAYSAITSNWFTGQGFTVGPNFANGGLDLQGIKTYLDNGYIILVNASNYPCKGCVNQFMGVGHYVTVDGVDVTGRRIHTRDPNNCSYANGSENSNLAWTDLDEPRSVGGGRDTDFHGAFPIKKL